jgi:transglutaminase-like putative cysteine protease
MSVTGLLRDAIPASEDRSTGAGSWIAFCLLALYGTVRWGTMLEQPAQGRLLLALLLALANAVALRRLPRRGNRDWLIPLLCLADVALVLLIAGYRFRWVLGGHWGHLGSAVSDGVSAIPGVLVPYHGTDPNTVAVIILGAGALLLCGGLAFGNVRGRPASGQLLLAALPLLALAIVPSAIVVPKLAALHGLVTFTLVALLVLSPRLAPERRGGGSLLLVSAAIIGAVIAGVVAGNGRPWLRVATGHAPGGTTVGGISSGPAEFNWMQSYGVLGRGSQTAVLLVNAKRPAYWKAEDLDRFSDNRWSLGTSSGDGLQGVSVAHQRDYSQTIEVSVKDMVSTQVIAAGYADAPSLIGVAPGGDPGTWTTFTPLASGASYFETVYTPDPTAAQLAEVGSDYPAALNRFRGLALPSDAYAGVEALSRRLSAGNPTPIAYVDAVLAYLQSGHGYVYTVSPPRGGRYPLVSFLLKTKRGYCQQFAGAMALLLRMRGIPARVAVGFSTGTRQANTDDYLVSAKDAHAWVEVWFPSYGWVTFDPTPGHGSGAANRAGATPTTPASNPTAATSTPASSPTPVPTHGAAGLGRLHGAGDGAAGADSSGAGVPVLGILAAIAGLGLLWFILRRLPEYWRRPTVRELTDELPHAFLLCGQPLGAEVTLAALAERLSDSPRAATYMRSLAASRYEAGGGVPTPRGRAALRLWLAQGLGPLGLLRALRALPPRRAPRADAHSQRRPRSGPGLRSQES